MSENVAGNAQRRAFQDLDTMGTAYHLWRPRNFLCLKLRTVANLQSARTAPREKVGNLLPSEVFLLLQVD